MPLILSLFDYSGSWSAPYRQAGYTVVQVDIQHGTDVYNEQLSKYLGVHGILAAPPCTNFCNSGARWWAEKDADGRTAKSVALVERTLEIVCIQQPEWWALENPSGRLQRLVPEIGNKVFSFDPCHFGHPYRKRTHLWGRFTVPEIGPIVEPMPYTLSGHTPWYSNLPRNKQDRENARSKTPEGFAQAFFKANP